jgi:DoxX-like family
MEAIQLQQPARTFSNKTVWTGRIISGVCVLFLLVDSIMKIVMHPMYVQGSTQLGFSIGSVQPIGIVLLACTILYCIPRTAVAGAILLAAYFGGAVATMVRTGGSIYFPVVFAILVWTGLYLRDKKLRALFSM